MANKKVTMPTFRFFVCFFFCWFIQWEPILSTVFIIKLTCRKFGSTQQYISFSMTIQKILLESIPVDIWPFSKAALPKLGPTFCAVWILIFSRLRDTSVMHCESQWNLIKSILWKRSYVVCLYCCKIVELNYVEIKCMRKRTKIYLPLYVNDRALIWNQSIYRSQGIP